MHTAYWLRQTRRLSWGHRVGQAIMGESKWGRLNSSTGGCWLALECTPLSRAFLHAQGAAHKADGNALGHKVLGFARRECAAWGGHSRAGAASQGCSKRNHLLQAPAKGAGASLNHTGEKRTIGVTDKICILAALLCLTASGSSQGFVGCPIYN